MADASFSYKKYQYIIYLYYHSLDSDSSSIDTYYFIHLFYTNLIIAFLFFGKNCLTAPPQVSSGTQVLLVFRVEVLQRQRGIVFFLYSPLATCYCDGISFWVRSSSLPFIYLNHNEIYHRRSTFQKVKHSYGLFSLVSKTS